MDDNSIAIWYDDVAFSTSMAMDSQGNGWYVVMTLTSANPLHRILEYDGRRGGGFTTST
jgi:hypothetical protein